MKPWYPEVLEVDPTTKKRVDERIDALLPARYR